MEEQNTNNEPLMAVEGGMETRRESRVGSIAEVPIKNSGGKGWMVAACTLVVVIVIAAIFTFGKTAEKKVATFSIPQAYQVQVHVLFPYSQLHEDAFVYVDLNKGVQSISYYSGANVFIYNTTGPSYTIGPVLDHKECQYNNGKEYNETTGEGMGSPLQDVFPKDFEALFTKNETTVMLRGEECDVYTYSYNGRLADKDGYLGNYTFYVSKKDQHPMRLYFHGHNIFLGGSHVDEYVLDYHNFVDLSRSGGVHDDLFKPPAGMKCVPEHGKTPAEKRAEDKELEQRRQELAKRDAGLHILLPGDDADRLRREEHDAHIDEHDKSYDSEDERAFRQAVYNANMRHIGAINRQNKGYTLDDNHMGDWTVDEMMRVRGYNGASNETLCQTDSVERIKMEQQADEKPVPRVVDYVNGPEKLVGKPGDQGSCGSCWTFGTTGAIEGAYAKKTGKFVKMSEQNILDCSWKEPFGNNGCGGGADMRGYEWVINNNNGLLADNETYPYINQDGFCKFDHKRGLVNPSIKAVEGLKMVGCGVVTERYLDDKSVSDEESVAAFVYKLAKHGPLGISINAEPKDFYFYKSGVYNSEECVGTVDKLDHAVLAVGYNLDHNPPYMVLKNSWSTNWGEGGFARVALNENVCGFATTPTYVILE
uniref:Uncharacterized protein n=2 Tax=Mucochytrium quahogii TaxID=96639 RepID=A0A7S2WHS9_9STRA